jgi:hypothetical protein
MKRQLRVFLCHSSEDKPAVREIAKRLRTHSVSPWVDEKHILPGQDWELEIRKAVRNSDAVIVCLSHTSVVKEGYVQREIRQALDLADEKPDGAIFLVPLRLDECNVPERLRRWQWVDYFRPRGHLLLLSALAMRAKDLDVRTPVRTPVETPNVRTPVESTSLEPLPPLPPVWPSQYGKPGFKYFMEKYRVGLNRIRRRRKAI